MRLGDKNKNHKLVTLQRDFQKCIASYIAEDTMLSDEGITILEVDIDKNLSRAKIYYVTLNNEPSEALENNRSKIRSLVARNFGKNIKRTPEIMFQYDRTQEKAWRINKIIDGKKDDE